MQVFGFDTMWVTSVENYQQDGVVFKGNVRSKDPAAAYAKMKQRLQVRPDSPASNPMHTYAPSVGCWLSHCVLCEGRQPFTLRELGTAILKKNRGASG